MSMSEDNSPERHGSQPRAEKKPDPRKQQEERNEAEKQAQRQQSVSGWPRPREGEEEGDQEPVFFDRGDQSRLTPLPTYDEEGNPEPTPFLTPGVGGALGGQVNLQPSYQHYMGVAYPGMPATMTTWDGDTYIVDKAATAAIPFGVAVSVKGVSLTDGSQRSIIVGGTAAACVGVTYRDITQMPSYVLQGNGYPAGWNAAVMSRGDIWIAAGGAISVSDPVKFAPATGIFSMLAGATITLANCRWMRGAAQAGDLALLRVNFPAPV